MHITPFSLQLEPQGSDFRLIIEQSSPSYPVSHAHCPCMQTLICVVVVMRHRWLDFCGGVCTLAEVVVRALCRELVARRCASHKCRWRCSRCRSSRAVALAEGARVTPRLFMQILSQKWLNQGFESFFGGAAQRTTKPFWSSLLK